MKRMIALLLALCLALAVTGCGGSGEEAEAVSIDLDAFYTSLTEGEDFPMMMPIEGELLENYYPGLAAVEREQTVMYMAAISATACEIAMVEVKNAGDVDKVKDIFQARIDAQVDGGAWYPETIEAWKNRAEIVVRGNYVALFVTPEEIASPAEAFKTA